MITLGMHCVHGAQLGSEPERLARLERLVVDPRWGATFRSILVGRVPGVPHEPVPRGRVAAKDLQRVAHEALGARTAEWIELKVGTTPPTDPARLYINTGRYARRPGWANARRSLPATDTEAATAAWIELQHAIVDAVGAEHGVIVAAPTFELAQIEIWLQNISLDGKAFHPHPDEIASYAVKAPQLGDEYLRAPRWGTYLSPKHLALIGGKQRVLDAVEPPVVREVGPLLYIQLSERVADAMSPETEAKRSTFEALVAPLLPPR